MMLRLEIVDLQLLDLLKLNTGDIKMDFKLNIKQKMLLYILIIPAMAPG